MKQNSNSVENGAPDDTQRKRKLNEISPIEKEPIPKLCAKDEEKKKLRALRMELEEMEQQVRIDSFLYVFLLISISVCHNSVFFFKLHLYFAIISNLKDMSEAEIVDTLKDYESILRKMFNKYAKIPDKKAEPSKAECDYLLILDGLLESEQQTKMYVTLREKFCDSDPAEPTSNVSEMKL